MLITVRIDFRTVKRAFGYRACNNRLITEPSSPAPASPSADLGANSSPERIVYPTEYSANEREEVIPHPCIRQQNLACSPRGASGVFLPVFTLGHSTVTFGSRIFKGSVGARFRPPFGLFRSVKTKDPSQNVSLCPTSGSWPSGKKFNQDKMSLPPPPPGDGIRIRLARTHRSMENGVSATARTCPKPKTMRSLGEPMSKSGLALQYHLHGSSMGMEPRPTKISPIPSPLIHPVSRRKISPAIIDFDLIFPSQWIRTMAKSARTPIRR